MFFRYSIVICISYMCFAVVKFCRDFVPTTGKLVVQFFTYPQ